MVIARAVRMLADEVERIFASECYPEYVDIELHKIWIRFGVDDLHSRNPVMVIEFPGVVMVVENQALVLQACADLIEKFAGGSVTINCLPIGNAAAHHVLDAHRFAVSNMAIQPRRLCILSVAKVRTGYFQSILRQPPAR